jgi:ACR3 family arsenite transporter
MAIPVILFFFLLFHIVYYTTVRMGFTYEDAATMGFHCTGRNFELAIAIALTHLPQCQWSQSQPLSDP